MKKLGLVFTDGVSLEQWVDQGLFSREKQIYEEHLKQNHFDKIVWFTYGVNDQYIRNELVQNGELDEKILVIPMPKLFDNKVLKPLYSYLIPYIHRNECKELDIIKTNQMAGAWTAAIIHKKYGIPFLLRTGYTYSVFLSRMLEGEHHILKKIKLKWKISKYKRIEQILYAQCDLATVSSSHDKKYICQNYKVEKYKVEIVRNYIDCNKFRKDINIRPYERFVFVGRLSEQKNLYNTIKGIAEAGYGLDVFGRGVQEKNLREYVEINNYDVNFMGVIENNRVPEILNNYKYYILASEYEGMPKTLLEAMACGLVCIGTNVEGINEIIKDKTTGYLSRSTNWEDIRNKIEEVQHEKNIEMVRKNAQDVIKKQYSLNVIVNLEWKYIKKIISREV